MTSKYWNGVTSCNQRWSTPAHLTFTCQKQKEDTVIMKQTQIPHQPILNLNRRSTPHHSPLLFNPVSHRTCHLAPLKTTAHHHCQSFISLLALHHPLYLSCILHLNLLVTTLTKLSSQGSCASIINQSRFITSITMPSGTELISVISLKCLCHYHHKIPLY